ncbi:MAG: hypothetical protein ACTSU2_10235 [Promethearchaeota archaeon]
MAQENFNKNIQSDLHHSNIYKNTVSPLSSSMISPQISFNYNGARNLSDLMAISHAIVNNDKDARLINELGANLLRNNIEWFRCARDYGKEAMKYNFSSYDTYYNYLLNNNITPLSCFVYGWGWWPNNHDLPKSDWHYYYNFTAEFVRHFNNTLTYYEMWNEPDIGFWTGSDEDFFLFLANITRIVRDNDKTAKILCPSISSHLDFVEKMINYFGAQKFAQMFDIFAFHAYNGHNGLLLTSRIDAIKNILNKYNLSMPLWITETGFSTAVKYDFQIASMKQENIIYQAREVVELYNQAIKENISSMFWYCLNDWCDVDDTNGEGRFGLLYCSNSSNREYAPKPSAYAFQILSNLINDGTYYPYGTNINGLISKAPQVSYIYTKRNTTVLIIGGESLYNSYEISLDIPDNKLASYNFTIKEYNYLSNKTQLFETDMIKNRDSFGPKATIKIDQNNNMPIILEINYSNVLNSLNLTQSPITIIINARYEGANFVIIFLLPIPSILGVVIIIVQRHRKENIIRPKIPGK